MSPIIVLAILCFVFCTAFNGIMPVTDPVESNYALTAKEMVLSGNWLSPQIYGQFWYDKPIMVYWWLAVSYSLFGFTDFAARLPSAIAATLSVLACYWFVRKIGWSQQRALLSALVLATSLQFWLLAHMILTDSLLLLFVSLAMGLLYLGLIGQGLKYTLLAYGAAGLAVLTKGPVGLVLPGLLVIVYLFSQKSWASLRQLHLLRGFLAFVLVAGPWYGYMSFVHGSAFVETFLGLHNVVRATVSEHPQDNVFYYYLVLFPLSILPWTFVFICRFANWLKKIKRAERTETYLFIWLTGYIIFFSLMATKYPTYVFPVLWPAAILTALELDCWINEANQGKSWFLTIPAVLQIGLFAVAGKFLPVTMPFHMILLTVLAILTLILKWHKSRAVFIVGSAFIVSVSCLVFTFSALVPLTEVRSAKEAVNLLPSEAQSIGIYGDYATSAVYYSNHEIIKLVGYQSEKEQNLWAGKYTMPTQRYGDFLNANDSVKGQWILINKKSLPSFLKEDFAGFFKVQKQSNSWYWLERE